MGRPIRMQFPGACYCITLQGSGRQNIFLSNSDRRFFLGLLSAYKERYDLKVYAYCLMDRQAELLLETGQAPLARVMQAFNTVYTKYFNKQHNLVGPVFRGRYRALLVDKANFLMEMTYHIHLEPVRAGLKEKPWRYLWSSCAAYVEGAEREPLVDSDPVLKALGRNRLKQSVEYLKAIKDRMRTAAKPTFPVYRSCVGSREFWASLPPSNTRAWEAASREKARRIIDDIAPKDAEQEELLGPARRRDLSAARRQAVLRIWKEAKVGVAELARLFRRTPSAISQMIRAAGASGSAR